MSIYRVYHIQFIVLPDEPVSCDFTIDSSLPIGCEATTFVIHVGWKWEAGDPCDTILKLYQLDYVLRTRVERG